MDLIPRMVPLYGTTKMVVETFMVRCMSLKKTSTAGLEASKHIRSGKFQAQS